MVSVIKNVGSEVSKVFENLVKNRIVGHLEKCCIFSDFQYGFRSSQSTADLVTVVPDRIVRTFNRSVATPALAFDISKASDSGSLFFFTNFNLMEFQIRYLASHFFLSLQQTASGGSGREVFTRIFS